MKYAILNPRNLIVRVEDSPPQSLINLFSCVEISDEIATVVNNGNTAAPRIKYFYENGKLMTFNEKMGIPGPQSPLSSADQWIEKQGFSSLRVIALMDAENKLAVANKNSAKLTAIRNWLDSVAISYIQNPMPRQDWPIAPFSFNETMQEALAALTT